MEEKERREVQDLFENRLHRKAAELQALGALIQGEGSSGIVLNEDERVALGWMIEDMATELDSISDKGVNLCLPKAKQEEAKS